MKPGTIVILNGASSSGKSSIARVLQSLLPGHFLHLGIDQYMARVPPGFDVISDGEDPGTAEGMLWIRKNGNIIGTRIGEYGYRVFEGIYRSYTVFSGLAVNIIVDDVIVEPKVLNLAARILRGLPVYLIGVLCSLSVVEAREFARGDRLPGLAAAFHSFINDFPDYDFTVDTSSLSPEKAAERIHDFIISGIEPAAIQKINQGEEYG